MSSGSNVRLIVLINSCRDFWYIREIDSTTPPYLPSIHFAWEISFPLQISRVSHTEKNSPTENRHILAGIGLYWPKLAVRVM